MDVPWSPYGIDGRSYDWQGLAAAADLLFMMAYDMQSQASLGRRGVGGCTHLAGSACKRTAASHYRAHVLLV